MSKLIVDLRKRAGLSFQDASLQLKWSPGELKKKENGEAIPFDKLVQLVHIYRADPAEICQALLSMDQRRAYKS